MFHLFIIPLAFLFHNQISVINCCIVWLLHLKILLKKEPTLTISAFMEIIAPAWAVCQLCSGSCHGNQFSKKRKYEGQPLKYFEDVEYSVKTAYKTDGTAWPYWTRTPWLCETYLVTVAGVTKLGDAPTDRYLGVRPAFCMEKDTIVWESDCIIMGESVYVIE